MSPCGLPCAPPSLRGGPGSAPSLRGVRVRAELARRPVSGPSAPPSCGEHREAPSDCDSSKSFQPTNCSTAAVLGGKQTLLVAIIVLLARLNSPVSIHLVKVTLISPKCAFGVLCAAPKCSRKGEPCQNAIYTAFTRGLLGTRVGGSRLPTHAPNAPLSRNV